jgi:hypothetical protein
MTIRTRHTDPCLSTMNNVRCELEAGHDDSNALTHGEPHSKVVLRNGQWVLMQWDNGIVEFIDIMMGRHVT